MGMVLLGYALGGVEAYLIYYPVFHVYTLTTGLIFSSAKVNCNVPNAGSARPPKFDENVEGRSSPFLFWAMANKFEFPSLYSSVLSMSPSIVDSVLLSAV